MAVSLVNTGITFPDGSTQTTRAAQAPAFTNRIINGAMVIDQRNAGASVTATVTGVQTYTIDRWSYQVSQASKFTIQQTPSATETGFATRVGAGFSNYLACTVGASANVTVGSTDYFALLQPIEGLNVGDLAWGTSNAKTITFSFWVNCSLTGTFGGALRNAALNRSYPFTYTISVANTWEQKSVTIAGDTSGTWLTTNGVGIYLQLNLGYGSTYSNTPNAWVAGNFGGANGCVNWISTNSATFYITGVQLEKGSTATSFDYRPYGTELALCQRYYEKSYDQGTAPATNTALGTFNFAGSSEGNGNVIVPIQYSTKRTAPTLTGYLLAGTAGSWNYERSGSSSTGSITFDRTSDRESRAYVVVGTNFVATYVYGHWIASAEL